MPKAQEWLDESYPKEERSQEDKNKLIISRKGLHGSLCLKDFAELEELDCSRNQIEKLELPFRITSLDCHRNSLTDLGFLERSQVNYNILTYLDISDNKFFNSRLICFRDFDQLKTLKISKSDVNKLLGEVYIQLYEHLKKCELEGHESNIIKMDEWKKGHLDLVSGRLVHKIESAERQLNSQEGQVEGLLSWIRQPLNYLWLSAGEATRSLFHQEESQSFMKLTLNALNERHSNLEGEVADLRRELVEARTEKQRLTAQTIINVQHGHAVIGSSFQDNTSLDYTNNRITELSQEEFQAQQLQIPRTNY